MKKLQILCKTMMIQMKNSFSRPMYRFCLIANPIVNTILLYEMFINSNKDNFVNSVILGAGLMGIWTCICFSSAGDINRERWNGTLSILYTTPADFRYIIMGKIFGNTFLSLLTFIITYITTRMLSGANFFINNNYQFIIAFISLIICFEVISILLAYLLTLSRKTILYMNLFEEFILLEFLYPIITMSFYCILAMYSFNTNNLTRWVVGNSFLLCVSICVFTLGTAFDAEKYYGRIKSIIISPMNKLLIIIEKGFFPMVASIVAVFFGFIIGSLIFNVDFMSINMGLFFMIIIVAMFSMTGFSLFISSFGLITDSMHFILNLIACSLMIFSGANFPISQLPEAIQFISKLIPLTRSITAANMLFTDYNNNFWYLILIEILIGVIYYLISYVVIQCVEKISKEKATLELF